MKRLLLLPLVFVLVSCAGRPPVQAQKPTAAVPGTPLEGKWREIKNEENPVTWDKTWAFEGNKITIKDGDRTYGGTFTYRDDREPKEIDLRFEDYPLNKGIYAIYGNMLHVKLLDSRVERATKLGMEPGYTFIMLEKIKEAAPR